MTPLSHSRLAVMRSIQRLTALHGCAPTLQDVAVDLHRTNPAIHKHVVNLRAMGWLRNTGPLAWSDEAVGALDRQCPHCGKKISAV